MSCMKVMQCFWQQRRRKIKMQFSYLHFKHPHILRTSDELSRSNFFFSLDSRKKFERESSSEVHKMLWCLNCKYTGGFKQYFIHDFNSTIVRRYSSIPFRLIFARVCTIMAAHSETDQSTWDIRWVICCHQRPWFWEYELTSEHKLRNESFHWKWYPKRTLFLLVVDAVSILCQRDSSRHTFLLHDLDIPFLQYVDNELMQIKVDRSEIDAIYMELLNRGD